MSFSRVSLYFPWQGDFWRRLFPDSLQRFQGKGKKPRGEYVRGVSKIAEAIKVNPCLSSCQRQWKKEARMRFARAVLGNAQETARPFSWAWLAIFFFFTNVKKAQLIPLSLTLLMARDKSENKRVFQNADIRYGSRKTPFPVWQNALTPAFHS